MALFLYVLTSSKNPDRVECSVPWKVDENEIYFGPCKKDLRKDLRSRFLIDREEASPSEAVWLAAVNGSRSPTEARKIVWAGRVRKVMTFRRAWESLVGARYEKLRGDGLKPLHLEPIIGADGALIGYRRCNELHRKKDEWIDDLIAPMYRNSVSISGNELRLKAGVSPLALNRDACMLLDNVFFATERGLDLDREVLATLQRAQSAKGRVVEPAAPFGRNRNNDVNGLRGTGLWLCGEDEKAFIDWLMRKIPVPSGNSPPLLRPQQIRRC